MARSFRWGVSPSRFPAPPASPGASHGDVDFRRLRLFRPEIWVTGIAVAKGAKSAGNPKPIQATSPPIVFEVLGTPAPKGSSRAILMHGRAVNIPGSSDTGKRKIKAWSSAVREVASEIVTQRYANADRSGPLFVATALEIEIEFRLTRPTGHFGTGKRASELKPSAPSYPQGKPDIDKLARTTLDALTGSVIDDDSRIARLGCTKVYAAPGHEGARIRIAAMGARATLAIVPPIPLAPPPKVDTSKFAQFVAPPASAPVPRSRIREIIGGSAFERDLPGHAVAKHVPTAEQLPLSLPAGPDDFGGSDFG